MTPACMSDLLAQAIRRALLPAGMLLCLGTAQAGPEGGQVVAGQGAISRPDTHTTVVNQSSQRLAIDWQRFNLAPSDQVRFEQPGATATALNRIFDQNPSQVLGSIQANGRVILMNPNGVFFGPNARVNVGALVAGGLKLGNQDFMAGRLQLEGVDGADGLVVNQGLIQAATGGSVTLIGKAVKNEGVILANAGRVNLLAGNRATLDFDGDGLLRFSVDEAVLENAQALDAAVGNSGTIQADGGEVLLSGRAARDVFSHTVNNSGVVKAARIDKRGGVVRLIGLGPKSSVLNTGRVDVSATQPGGQGGTITIAAQAIEQAGSLHADASAGAGGHIELVAGDRNLLDGVSVTSARGQVLGGQIEVLGDRVGIVDRARVDVSGARGGGQALIGGDYRGGNAGIRNASLTVVSPDALILADAVDSGDGGRVIVWSDRATAYYGGISARGGSNGGDGGFAEVSGKGHLDFHGTVNLAAPDGHAGQLLLDPLNLELVSNANAGSNTSNGPHTGFNPNNIFGFGEDPAKSSIMNVDAGGDFNGIAAGTTVTLEASNDLTVTDAFNLLTATGSAGVSISLRAGRDILINNNIVTDAGGEIRLEAARDITVSSATLQTQGGVNGNAGITLIANSDAFDLSDSLPSQSSVTTAGNVTLTNAILDTTDLAGGVPGDGAILIDSRTIEDPGGTAGTVTASGSILLNNGTQVLSNGGDVTIGDGAGQLFSDTILVQGTVSIDTATTSATAGNVTLGNGVAAAGSHRIDDSGANDSSLSIDVTAAGTDGTVSLVDIGGTTPLGALAVTAGAGVITLNGTQLRTSSAGTGTGNITFGSSFKLTADTSISTVGGILDFSSTTVYADATGPHTLSIDTTDAGAGGAGNILLGAFSDRDQTGADIGAFVNTLSLNALDAGGNGNLSFSGAGNVLLDYDAGTATAADLSFSGGNIGIGGTMQIDTAQSANNAGLVNLGNGTVFANTAGVTLTIDASSAAGNGGAVTLGTVSSGAGQLLSSIAIRNTGTVTDGTLTLNGNVSVDGGDIDLTQVNDIELGAALVLDTETGDDQNAGRVRFAAASNLDSLASASLGIDTSVGGGFTGGDIQLGIIGATAQVGGLVIDTTGGVGGTVSLNGDISSLAAIDLSNAVTTQVVNSAILTTGNQPISIGGTVSDGGLSRTLQFVAGLGALSLNNVVMTTAGSGISITSAGSMNLSGTINTDNTLDFSVLPAGVSFNLTSTAGLISGSGNIAFTGTNNVDIVGAPTLSISANSGAVLLNQVGIGGAQPGSLTVSADTLSLAGAIAVSGNLGVGVSLTEAGVAGDAINIANSITADTGSVVISGTGLVNIAAAVEATTGILSITADSDGNNAAHDLTLNANVNGTTTTLQTGGTLASVEVQSAVNNTVGGIVFGPAASVELQNDLGSKGGMDFSGIGAGATVNIVGADRALDTTVAGNSVGGNIDFSGLSIEDDATGGGLHGLSLNAGTGGLILLKDAGQADTIKNLTLIDAAGVQLGGAIAVENSMDFSTLGTGDKLTLSGPASITSATGLIDLSSPNVNGAQSLALTANAGSVFLAAVGNTVPLTSLSINTGTADLGGDVTTTGLQNITAATINLAGAAYRSDDGAITLTGAVDLTGTGLVTLDSDANSDAIDGAIQVTGAISDTGSDSSLSLDADTARVDLDDVSLGNNLSVTGAPISLNGSSYQSTAGGSLAFNGLTELNAAAGTVSIQSNGGGADDITFAGDVNDPGMDNPLQLTAGAGTLTFGSGIGVTAGQALTTLTIVSSGSTAVTGVTNAATVAIQDTSTSVVFGGAVAITTALTTANKGYSVSFNGGGTVAGDTTFLNSGGVSFGDDNLDDISFPGGLDTTAGNTTARGFVRTDGAQMDIAGLGLAGATTLDTTGNGNTAAGATLNLGPVTGAGQALTLNLGSTNFSIQNDIGSPGNELASLTLSQSGAVTLGADVFANAQDYSAAPSAVVSGSILLDADAGAGNINFTGVNITNTAASDSLTLTAGGGDTISLAQVGTAALNGQLALLAVNGGLNASLSGNLYADSIGFNGVSTITQTANITLDGDSGAGDVNLGTSTIAGGGFNLIVEAGNNSNVLLGGMSNIGNLDINAGAATTVTLGQGGNAVSVTDFLIDGITGTFRLEGDLSDATGGLNFSNASEIQLSGSGDVNISLGDNPFTTGGTAITDAGADSGLNINAGSSSISLDVVGATGAKLTNLRLTADAIDFVAGVDSVFGVGNLLLRPKLDTTSIDIGVAAGSGTLDISSSDLAAIADGFGSIDIGAAVTGAHDIVVGPLTGAATIKDPLTIHSPAATGIAPNVISITGNITTSGNGAVTFDGPTSFGGVVNISVTGAGGLNFNDNVVIGSPGITFTANGGDIVFNGFLDSEAPGGVNENNPLSLVASGDVSFNQKVGSAQNGGNPNTGSLGQLAIDATNVNINGSLLVGGLDITASGVTGIGADITTTGLTHAAGIALTGLDLSSATGGIGLTAPVVLDTSANNLDVDLTGSTVSGAGNALGINAGGGATVTTGSMNGLGTLTLSNAAGFVFNGAIGANALASVAQPYFISFNAGGNIGGNTVFQNTGSLTLGNDAADSLSFVGGVDTTGVPNPAAVRVAGTVATTDAAMTLGNATGALSLLDTTVLDSGTGSLTVGAISAGANDLTVNAGAVNFTGGMLSSGALSINNSGLFTLTGGDVAADGGIGISGAASLARNLTTVANDLGIGGVTTLAEAANVTLSTGNGAGDITVAGVNGTAGGVAEGISFRAGSGMLTAAALGSAAANELESVTLLSADTALFNGAINLANTLSLNGVTTGASFAGDVSAGSFINSAGAYAIAMNGGGTIGGPTSFNNTGGTSLGDGGDVFTFIGGLDTSANGVTTSATINTTNTAMNLGALTVAGPTILNAGAGAAASIAVTGVSGAGLSLATTANDFTVSNGPTNLGTLNTNGTDVTLNGGGTIDTSAFTNTGNLNLNGNGGGFVFTNGLNTTAGPATANLSGSISTMANPLTLATTNIIADTTLTADNFTLGGNVSPAGAGIDLVLQQDSGNLSIGAAGSSLSGPELALLQAGFNSLTLGRAGTGTLNIDGAGIFLDPVTLQGATIGLNADVGASGNMLLDAATINFSGNRILTGGGAGTGVILNGNVSGAGNFRIDNAAGAGILGGNISAADMIFNVSVLPITGNTLMRSSSNIIGFGGAVFGNGNLDIDPTAGTAMFIDNAFGAGHIRATAFANFGGHLIIGGALTPMTAPATDATVATVNAASLSLDGDLISNGPVTLLAQTLNLNASLRAGAAGPGGKEVTLVASNGDIVGPTAGISTIQGSSGVILASGDFPNATNVNLDFGGGNLLVALGNAAQDPTFGAGSSATQDQSTDVNTIPLVQALGLNLQAVQVVFSNPASALSGLDAVKFIDVGVFEEELTLFGVIGSGIAQQLSQCEELEGCAPNVTEEQLHELIKGIQARIDEIKRRMASGALAPERGEVLLQGYQAELANFEKYLTDFKAWQAQQAVEEETLDDEEDFGDEESADQDIQDEEFGLEDETAAPEEGQTPGEISEPTTPGVPAATEEAVPAEPAAATETGVETESKPEPKPKPMLEPAVVPEAGPEAGGAAGTEAPAGVAAPETTPETASQQAEELDQEEDFDPDAEYFDPDAEDFDPDQEDFGAPDPATDEAQP